MPRFEVVYCDEAKAMGLIDDLWGHDSFWCLIENQPDGTKRLVGTDGGEPEDQLLVRDWRWVAEEMNKLADEAEVAKKGRP